MLAAFGIGALAGGVGGGVGGALQAAQIGGFQGGAILGASTGFAQSVTSGLINNDISLNRVLKSTFIGAGIGGLIGSIDAVIHGQRFLDGRSKILTERYLLSNGHTPLTESSPNQISGKRPMSKAEAIERGEVGLIEGKVVDRMGTTNPNLRNMNRGFEGNLQLNGYAYVPEGREFYVNVDGKDILTTTKGLKIDMAIPSRGRNISWGYRGEAIQQTTVQNGLSIGVTVRPNSYIYVTRNHRGWDGFLFWGR